MAHIQVVRPVGALPRLIVNGVDMTDEIYAGSIQLVAHGDPSAASEIALQMRIAVSRLDIGDRENVEADLDLTALFGGFVYIAQPLEGDV